MQKSKYDVTILAQNENKTIIKVIELKMYKKQKVNNIVLITYISEDKFFPFFSIANRFIRDRKGARRITSSNDSHIEVIIRFLNYLHEKLGIFYEDDFEKVTVEHAQKFVTDYQLTLSDEGDYPSNTARKEVRNKITMFLLNMKESRLCSQKRIRIIYFFGR